MDKVLFEERTEFQKVQICHTKSFGNVLLLDDLQSKCWKQTNKDMLSVLVIVEFISFTDACG